jgi:hypothetical protein
MSDADRPVEPREAARTVLDDFPSAEPRVTDPAVVGRPAVVTIRIPGGAMPGEVRLQVRGTFECLIAYAVEPLEVGRHVVVTASRGSRAATVTPSINGA